MTTLSSRAAPCAFSCASRLRRALPAAFVPSKHPSSTPRLPLRLAPVPALASPGPCATSLIGSLASLHRPRRSRHGRRLRQADHHGCALVRLLTRPRHGSTRARADAAARRLVGRWGGGAW